MLSRRFHFLTFTIWSPPKSINRMEQLLVARKGPRVCCAQLFALREMYLLVLIYLNALFYRAKVNFLCSFFFSFPTDPPPWHSHSARTCRIPAAARLCRLTSPDCFSRKVPHNYFNFLSTPTQRNPPLNQSPPPTTQGVRFQVESTLSSKHFALNCHWSHIMCNCCMKYHLFHPEGSSFKNQWRTQKPNVP